MDSPELILAEKPANLFRGLEGVGGKLKVTNYRLIFTPHALNIQSEPEEILISNIASVRPHNLMGFIPNQMILTLVSGEERRFVVWGRQRLIELIERSMMVTKTNHAR